MAEGSGSTSLLLKVIFLFIIRWWWWMQLKVRFLFKIRWWWWCRPTSLQLNVRFQIIENHISLVAVFIVIITNLCLVHTRARNDLFNEGRLQFNNDRSWLNDRKWLKLHLISHADSFKGEQKAFYCHLDLIMIMMNMINKWFWPSLWGFVTGVTANPNKPQIMIRPNAEGYRVGSRMEVKIITRMRMIIDQDGDQLLHLNYNE